MAAQLCQNTKFHCTFNMGEYYSFKKLLNKNLSKSEWKFHTISSVQFSRSIVSDSLQLHELQHASPPCPSPTPGVYPNSCALSQWCHPAISSSVIPFSSCPQSLPALGSFPMSQLFAGGDQSIGVSASASVLPMNTQDWSPLDWTGWISLKSKGHTRVSSQHRSSYYISPLRRCKSTRLTEKVPKDQVLRMRVTWG